jgi:hypothetical protein
LQIKFSFKVFFSIGLFDLLLIFILIFVILSIFRQSMLAHALYQRDRDYVVKDGEVIIVDEFTGRLMIGRRYSEGLHQAIEAKEDSLVVDVTRLTNCRNLPITACLDGRTFVEGHLIRFRKNRLEVRLWIH